MKNLSEILYGVNLIQVIGKTNVNISSITNDSRKANNGSLFFAVKGTVTDGHQYIDNTISQGAVAIICEEIPKTIEPTICYVKVKDASIATAVIANNYFDAPSSKLKLVAVTGTNGKTTIATLLYRLFKSLNKKVGLLSTVENKINNKTFVATHTTPDSIRLNELLNEMVNDGCEYCFMEASSHAIEQKRTHALTFTGAVFTNITRDHLDYHLTFDNYIRAKQKLFDALPSTAFALSNADDKNGVVMLQHSKAKKYYYSLSTISDFSATLIENSFEGLHLSIDGIEVYTSLVGEFNAYNLLAIYSTGKLLGLDTNTCLTALSKLDPAEGRFDYIISENDRVIGIVDYAHTPDALEKVLQTINDIRTGNEKIITIVGCGGDRDKGKRPMMAKVAAELSDRIILTSDNPRSEDPSEILNEMKTGVPAHKTTKTLSISDRKEAIKAAVEFAQKGDIILLAGKGHEKYQEIKGVKHPFDDKQMLNEIFKSAHK